MMDYCVSMWITSLGWFLTAVLLQAGIQVSSQERVTGKTFVLVFTFTVFPLIIAPGT